MSKLGQSQTEGPLPFERPNGLIEAREGELSKPKPSQVFSGQSANGGIVAPQMNGPGNLRSTGTTIRGMPNKASPRKARVPLVMIAFGRLRRISGRVWLASPENR